MSKYLKIALPVTVIAVAAIFAVNVYVLRGRVVSLPAAAASSSQASPYMDGKLNINTASRSQLADLPGIGDAIAGSIIEYRFEQGNFKSIQELEKVKGIGEKKLYSILPLICC